MTVTNKPGHKYSKSLRYKPRHINSKDTLTLSLSLFLVAIVYGQAISHIQYSQLGSLHYRGAGYLTFIILTVSLSLPKWPLNMGRLSPISNIASWASCIIRVQAISLL